MSKELSTKKDIIKAVALKSEFTEEQLEEYYKFFLETMPKLMNDPKTISIKISKYFGDLYLRLKSARLSYYSHQKNGTTPPEQSVINYNKMDLYLDKIKERKIFINFKRNYSMSPFMTDGLTIKELEEKQNSIYEKRKQDKSI